MIETSTRLVEYAEALRAGTGPVAVDAERASGYRYGQRAYLVQMRRNGSGTGLLDPIPLPDLSVIQDAIGDEEWVLHAANQDLPCLAEIGLVPQRIFDTELAARLAGLPRVGLGAVVESLLGFSLQKGHSAADWSTRPLPEEWLVYAALDVEVLVDLRDALAAILEEQGKTEWARQEFEAILAAGPPAPQDRPLAPHVRGPRPAQPPPAGHPPVALGGPRRPGPPTGHRARPGAPRLGDGLRGAGRSGQRGRAARTARVPRPGQPQLVGVWFSAIARGRAVPENELPLHSKPGEGPPPVNRWSDRDPAAATRLHAARAGLAQISTQHAVPVENVLSPDLVRRIMWSPPKPREAATVAEALRAGGARDWQIELTLGVLADAVTAA